MAEQIDVNINVNTKQAGQGVSEIKDGVDGIGESANMATGALDSMSGGAVSGFQNFLKGAKLASKSMFTLKGAIISTGIGALVVLIGSLIAYFTQTERGAKKLEVVMAVLGAVVNTLVDVFAKLGEYIVEAVMSPQKALDDLSSGLEYLWTHVKNVVDVIKKGLIVELKMIKKWFLIAAKGAAEFFTLGLADTSAMQKEIENLSGEIQEATDDFVESGKAMVDHVVQPFKDAAKALDAYAKELLRVAREQTQITLATQELRKAQRELNIDFAEGRAQIKEYNMIAEDMSKPLDERIEAATQAIAIEQELMAERQRQAEQELSLHRRTMALSESTEEDKERENELEVALINIRTESAEMQTTLNNKLQTMKKAAAAENQRLHDEEMARQQEIQDLAHDTADVLMSANEKELDALLTKAHEAKEAQKAEIALIKKRGEDFPKELALAEQRLQDIRDFYYQAELDLIAKQDAEKERLANIHKEFMLTDEQRELAALEIKHKAIRDAAIAAGEFDNALKDKLAREKHVIIDKYAAAEVATAKATAAAVKAANIGLIKSGFEVLQGLAKTEEGQKKLAIAQILVNQGIALSNAIAGAMQSATATGPGAVFSAPGFTATLVGLVLSSFAQVKGIMNQAGAATDGLDTSMPDFGGGGGGGGGGSDSQLALTPDLAQSFNDALGSQAIQAYVVQQEIADADALAATLQNQASLGGG